jgi:hypothetical protein
MATITMLTSLGQVTHRNPSFISIISIMVLFMICLDGILDLVTSQGFKRRFGMEQLEHGIGMRVRTGTQAWVDSDGFTNSYHGEKEK